MSVGLYALRPIALPHQPYPIATLRVVEKAIAEAWRIIRDHPEDGFDIKTANEDRITLELRNCLLNNVLAGGSVPGFTSDLFDVTREGKFESYDGTHLDKMPDFHIKIRRGKFVSLLSADGLFVECKPVGSDHPAGGAYCDKGIIRFVSGEYAWAMPQGLMVGYAAPGYKMPDKLEAAFKTRRKELGVKGAIEPIRGGAAQGYSQKCFVTVHRRDFKYPSTGKKAPEISLRHAWFDRS
jgi:hypothetical protein